MSILAKEHSRCRGCNAAIRPGEAIVEVDGRWLHEECGF